jgi:acyl-CoA thioesterase-1
MESAMSVSSPLARLRAGLISSVASSPWLALTLLFVNGAISAGAADPSAGAGRAGRRSVRIAVLGDSLASGYGLPADAAFPAQLEQALRRQGFQVVVSNAGVSGDTSAGGRARLEWTLAGDPDILVVELGANDSLRGLDPGRMEENLDFILATSRERGVQVLLAGMRAPGNMGEEYVGRFGSIFPRLATRYDVALYPFFLEGVAGEPRLNQADGIHPNERGVATIVEGILPQVRHLVEAVLAADGD